MKLSVSLSEEDVAILDEHVRRRGLPSRSAAVHEAVRMLRYPDLEAEYVAAAKEWRDDPDRELWESTVGDGID